MATSFWRTFFYGLAAHLAAHLAAPTWNIHISVQPFTESDVGLKRQKLRITIYRSQPDGKLQPLTQFDVEL